MSPKIARVIRWNVRGLYQQKAQKLLKEKTEHVDILTRNNIDKAVVNGDAILDSNFKSLFKSMVSNLQNLNQVGIEEFIFAFRSFDSKKDDIGGELLKIKYSNVAPYIPTNVVRHYLNMRMSRKMMMIKTYVRQS